MIIKSVVEKGDNWSINVPLGTQLEIMGYEVPSRVRLRYRKVGNYLGNVLGWGTCYWIIYKNGVEMLRILDQIGYAAQRELFSHILVFPGDRISVVGVNPAAFNCDMGVTFTWDEEAFE